MECRKLLTMFSVCYRKLLTMFSVATEAFMLSYTNLENSSLYRLFCSARRGAYTNVLRLLINLDGIVDDLFEVFIKLSPNDDRNSLWMKYSAEEIVSG